MKIRLELARWIWPRIFEIVLERNKENEQLTNAREEYREQLLEADRALVDAGRARIKAEDELREAHRKIETLREELDAARKDALTVREKVTDFFTMSQWRRPLFGEAPQSTGEANTTPISMSQKMRASDIQAAATRAAYEADREQRAAAREAMAQQAAQPDTRSEEEKKAAADIARVAEGELLAG